MRIIFKECLRSSIQNLKSESVPFLLKPFYGIRALRAKDHWIHCVYVVSSYIKPTISTTTELNGNRVLLLTKEKKINYFKLIFHCS